VRPTVVALPATARGPCVGSGDGRARRRHAGRGRRPSGRRGHHGHGGLLPIRAATDLPCSRGGARRTHLHPHSSMLE